MHTTEVISKSGVGAIGVPSGASTGNNMDLLDLLGGIGDPSPVLTSNDTTTTTSNNNILDGFGGGTTGSSNGGGGLLDGGSLFGGVGVGMMNNSVPVTNHNSIMGGGLGGGLLDDLTLSSLGGADIGGEVRVI